MTKNNVTKPHVLIIPRERHNVSRKEISKSALKVLYRLNRAGYEAYLVGGGVRDLLLGKKPKDFDVTTNATPEQLRKLFKNCRLVGRRFRLAHVMFGSETIEVATFRGYHRNKITDKTIFQSNQNDILQNDNIFGSVEEDAQRRDFTINSLYYSATDFTVRDYVGGIQDLKKGIIRLIGNPETRYREDPVRMLRAVRFAIRLNMRFSSKTAEPIARLAILINNIPPTRLFEEALKLLQPSHTYHIYKLLREYNLFQSLFPVIVHYLTENGDSLVECMIKQVFHRNYNYVHSSMSTNLACLFAAMFWYPMLDTTQKIIKDSGMVYREAFTMATKKILNEVCCSLAIPKRIVTLIQDIWQLQLRIHYYQDKHAWKLLKNPKFLAAYYLLHLRAKVERNQELHHLSQWWSKFIFTVPTEQKDIPTCLSKNLMMHHSYRCQYKRNLFYKGIV